ncbi:antibiotic biosynthesis monooxygenase [Kitasatospora terrestris]|uniref:ABM domain-containing protein n=1 Tax=Kitasatospora terrestris TaxID=258051 RepID=A0ABP9ECZ2_9ACTN
MYVRTIYLTGDPARVDRTVERIKDDAVGLLTEQDGYRGASIFVDRTVGTILLGSWWETREAEQASLTAMKGWREDVLGAFGGTATVDVWEAAVARRGDPVEGGAFRLVRLEFEPGSGADRLAASFEATAVKGLEALDGFIGGALLVDRDKGTGSVGVIFRDRAALDASRGPQALLRAKAAEAAGVRVRSIEEFDVALLHRP